MENQTEILTIENRKILKLNGVTDVGLFNESEIRLIMKEGVKLAIFGDKMQIIGFDKRTGECALAGKINSLKFIDKTAPTFKRFFK